MIESKRKCFCTTEGADWVGMSWDWLWRRTDGGDCIPVPSDATDGGSNWVMFSSSSSTLTLVPRWSMGPICSYQLNMCEYRKETDLHSNIMIRQTMGGIIEIISRSGNELSAQERKGLAPDSRLASFKRSSCIEWQDYIKGSLVRGWVFKLANLRIKERFWSREQWMPRKYSSYFRPRWLGRPMFPYRLHQEQRFNGCQWLRTSAIHVVVVSWTWNPVTQN